MDDSAQLTGTTTGPGILETKTHTHRGWPRRAAPPIPIAVSGACSGLDVARPFAVSSLFRINAYTSLKKEEAGSTQVDPILPSEAPNEVLLVLPALAETVAVLVA